MSAVAERRETQPPTTSVAALVVAARAGDRRAFAELYRRHARTVHGVLLSRLPHSELRDAMQDVFTLALSKLGSLREVDSFSAWLATIARNLARDWHKHRREHSTAPQLLDDRRAASRDLDDALGLMAIIHELPEDQRELLVLRFVEGLSGQEIAAALGLTPGSARVKLHRAMTVLRERLDVQASGGQP